jgi:hypothetical protein
MSSDSVSLNQDNFLPREHLGTINGLGHSWHAVGRGWDCCCQTLCSIPYKLPHSKELFDPKVKSANTKKPYPNILASIKEHLVLQTCYQQI